MFEKSPSFQPPTRQSGTAASPAAAASASVGSADAPVAGLRRGETALKAIEWCDLSARLDAARDLRLALRHEARRHIEDAAASFSDAAAQYFRTLEQSKQAVNLGSLPEHSGSGPIVAEEGGAAAPRGLHADVFPDDAKEG